MFRSMLVTSGCALELTLAVQEFTVLGVQIGLLSAALALCGTLAHVRRLSRQLVGIDLPSSPVAPE
jgi:hypothetical protein